MCRYKFDFLYPKYPHKKDYQQILNYGIHPHLYLRHSNTDGCL